jgi:hypothetical protein
VTTAATRDKLGLSVDVDEDGGVAEGVVEGVVEPSLLCVGVVELSSQCPVVGDVSVVERSLRCYVRSNLYTTSIWLCLVGSTYLQHWFCFWTIRHGL